MICSTKICCLSFLTALLFLLAGCNDGLNECFSGPGQITTKRIGLYEFRNLKVNDNIDLVLENGSDFSAVVTGGENVIPMLEFSIVSNTLHISNNSTCPMFKKPWDNINVLLTVPTLDTLMINSYGSVSCDRPFTSTAMVIIYRESTGNVDINVSCETLRLNYLSGTGDITIRGTAERGFVFHTGFGVVDFTGLTTQFLNLNLQSLNHTYVQGGEQYFFVVTSGPGNVYYSNNPGVIDWYREGTGELIKINP
jgi:hypothetical protein